MSTPRSGKALGRDVGDDYVDRRQVEAWRHVEPSRTNPPRGLTSARRAGPASCSAHPRGEGKRGREASAAPPPRSTCTPGHPGPEASGTQEAWKAAWTRTDVPLRCALALSHHLARSHTRGRTHASTPRRGPPTMVGGCSAGVTPVPISNTAVKPCSADGTAGETRWESTSPPAFHADALGALIRGSGGVLRSGKPHRPPAGLPGPSRGAGGSPGGPGGGPALGTRPPGPQCARLCSTGPRVARGARFAVSPPFRM